MNFLKRAFYLQEVKLYVLTENIEIEVKTNLGNVITLFLYNKKRHKLCSTVTD